MLLSSLLIQLSSTGLIFQFQVGLIRKSQIDRIKDAGFKYEELTSITTAPQNITWVEENEFLYRGEMYDLVGFSEFENCWHLTALKDDKEKMARANFARHMQDNTKGANSKYPPIKLATTPYILPGFEISSLAHTVLLMYADIQNNLFLSRHTEIVIPPPEA